MKTKILFLSIVLFLLSANVFAQRQQSATSFVGSFYKFHRARSLAFNAIEVNARKRWFTAELNRLLQNEVRRQKEFTKRNPDEKPHFGDGFPFAPIEECYKNGNEIKNVLKLSAPKSIRNKTVVEAKFYYPRACSAGGELAGVEKIELVKSKGGWLISDLIYADGKRLSDDLKRTEY
jgi:hypothetical protein